MAGHSPKSIDGPGLTAFVRARYGVDVLSAVPLEGWWTRNAAWAITTSRGGWIGKIFEPGAGALARIEDEVAVYRFLNAHGIRAPLTVTSVRGRDVEELESASEPYFFMAMPLEDLRKAEPSSITRDELERVGRETARMHALLRSYSHRESVGPGWRPPAHSPLSRPRDVELLGRSPLAEEFGSEQRRRLEATDGRLRGFVRDRRPSTTLTESLIHGDLTLDHARFLPGGNVYFFDFTDRGWGAVAEDLAAFLVDLYLSDDLAFEGWEELRRWFLAGYQGVARLTAEDRSAVWFFAVRDLLRLIGYWAMVERPNDQMVQLVCRDYQLGDYILEHYGQDGL